MFAALATLWAILVPGSGAAFAATGTWQSIGPAGGAAPGLAVHPLDPRTVYAASGAGGLFKTVDGGQSWSHSDSGLLPATLTKVLIDPVTPTTLYTLAAPDSFGESAVNSGVYKSTDGGTTWVSASNGLANSSGGFPLVADFAIDPQTPTTLYAAVLDRVFKSVDGAASWTDSGAGLRPQLQVTALAVDPVQPAIVYLGTSIGVWKSSDGAATWQPMRTGIWRVPVAAPTVDPNGHQTVYAASGDPQAPGRPPPRGLFVSADGGSTWTSRPVSAGNPSVSCVTVSPAADRAVYACAVGEGLFRSLDGGAHWQPIDLGFQSAATSFGAVAVAPAMPSRLYAGVALPSNTGPTVYRTSNQGTHWTPAGSGFKTVELASFAVDPRSPGTLYSGSATDGVLKTTDDGGSWTLMNRGLRGLVAVNALAIDPTTPANVFVETDGGFYASHNGGVRWGRPGAQFQGQAPLVVDPQTPSTIYSTEQGHTLSKSVDGGATWTPLMAPATTVQSCALAPSAPSTLYVARSDFFAGTLLGSQDGGATFRSILSVPALVSILGVDPTNPKILYFQLDYSIFVRTGLYKSTNGGLGAQVLLAGNQRALSMVIDPANPQVVYIGTFLGVQVSRDGGVTWADLAAGLPPLPVWQLAFGPGGVLYARVEQRGLYRISL